MLYPTMRVYSDFNAPYVNIPQKCLGTAKIATGPAIPLYLNDSGTSLS
jgi:hypothetical protein